MKSDLKQIKKLIKMLLRSFCCFCHNIQLIRNSIFCRDYKHKQCLECVLTDIMTCAAKKMRNTTKIRKYT